jgi:hypothetical protein
MTICLFLDACSFKVFIVRHTLKVSRAIMYQNIVTLINGTLSFLRMGCLKVVIMISDLL